MLSHGGAPSGLLLSTTVHVLKDKRGNKSDSSNYRAIAISSILGKLLDSIIIQDQHVSLKTDDLQFRFNPRAPSATYMLQEINTHIATHILNKFLQYVCVDILHIQLDLYTETNLLFNIISLSHMSEHISKSELFRNKRNTVKSSTLDQNISILEMSCEYKKNMWI